MVNIDKYGHMKQDTEDNFISTHPNFSHTIFISSYLFFTSMSSLCHFDLVLNGNRSYYWLVLIQTQSMMKVNLCFTGLLRKNSLIVLWSYWSMVAVNQWVYWTPSIWRKWNISCDNGKNMLFCIFSLGNKMYF